VHQTGHRTWRASALLFLFEGLKKSNSIDNGSDLERCTPDALLFVGFFLCSFIPTWLNPNISAAFNQAGDMPEPPIIKLLDEEDPWDDMYAFPSRGLVGIQYPSGKVFPIPLQRHVQLTCPKCVCGILFHIQLHDSNDQTNKTCFKQIDGEVSACTLFDSRCPDGKGMSCGIECPHCTNYVQFTWRMSAGYHFPTRAQLDSDTIDYTVDEEIEYPTENCDMEKSQSSDSDIEPPDSCDDDNIDS
jgi:hypothetical protein